MIRSATFVSASGRKALIFAVALALAPWALSAAPDGPMLTFSPASLSFAASEGGAGNDTGTSPMGSAFHSATARVQASGEASAVRT